MCYYLLYFGIARSPFSSEDFNSLLEQARSRNETLHITGKLLYCEGTFIQLLEGDENAVAAVYHSISQDDRLIALKKITEGYAEKRYYQNWSMAFDQISLREINKIEHCDHANVASYIKSSSAIKLLKLLAKT